MDEEPKSPWESATIRAAFKGFLATAVSIALKLGGQTYDIAWMKDVVNLGGDLFLQGLSLWYYYKAAQGRINATQPITKKEKP
jgi:hypothetical protein